MLTISRVRSRGDLARFVDTPWQVLDRVSHPEWIPPLRLAVRESLDTARDPFYRNATRELFLAERGGRTVGRIAAIENRAHNNHFGDRTGFFGFFECIDDGEVAARLVEAAEGWLAERGLEAMRGPMNPSMNHGCGLLVDGFDEPQVVLTPWNPPYYADLVEGCGLAPVRDLLGYDTRPPGGFDVQPRLERLAERALRSERLAFRDADYRRFEEEVKRVWSVWNEAWAGNWGFVPSDWEDFRYLALGLKPILKRDFSFLAEVDGEPVGFMLIVADINQMMRPWSSGRLTPGLLWKLLLRTARMKHHRVMLLGLKGGNAHRALFPLMLHEAMRRGKAIGALSGEASWVLEDNTALRRPLESLGMPATRRWRIYEKSISAGTP